MPFNLPLCYPKEYSVLPLASIVHADLKAEHLGWRKTVRIYHDTGDGTTDLIEFEVLFLHRWVKALRILGIPVSGGEALKLTTLRGLMNESGWVFWFGILGLAWMASLMLWQMFHPNRNNVDFLVISFGVLSSIYAFIGLVLTSLFGNPWIR
jgi:hypothetical protein